MSNHSSTLDIGWPNIIYITHTCRGRGEHSESRPCKFRLSNKGKTLPEAQKCYAFI